MHLEVYTMRLNIAKKRHKMLNEHLKKIPPGRRNAELIEIAASYYEGKTAKEPPKQGGGETEEF